MIYDSGSAHPLMLFAKTLDVLLVRILWLGSRGLLHPTYGGATTTTYHLLRNLKQRHNITFISRSFNSDKQEYISRASEYCDKIVRVPWPEPKRFSLRQFCNAAMIASPLPHECAVLRSVVMKRAIERELRESKYDLVVCDSLAPSINLSETTVPKVLFEHNVKFLVWYRSYKTSTNSLQRAYAYSQWFKTFYYERATCRRFDAVIAASPVDHRIMDRDFGLGSVYELPPAVDSEYFSPSDNRPDPFGIVFTGTMAWHPNEDGLVYFAKEILPRIASALPKVRLTIVGRDPPEVIRALARADNRVAVTGTVQDVRPYIDRAACYIVPLRIGSGRRVKIFEAMAMGKAVVSTTIGAEGLPVRTGEHLLLADGSEDFAQAVISILSDRALADRLGKQARAFAQTYGWGEAAATFEGVCKRVLGNRPVS